MSQHELVPEAPHEILAQDMARDYVGQLSLVGNWRVRNVLKAQGAAIIRTAWLAASLLEKKHLDGVDFSSQELFPEYQAESIVRPVEAYGAAVSHYFLDFMRERSFFASSNLYYGRNVKLPESGKRVIVNQWAKQIWAPDYAARFADAVVNQDQLTGAN